jgi:hypothetical protein
MAAIETYRHSGKMGPAAIPYALGAGLVAAGALSWVYQALIDGIPFVYLNVLATAGYGIAVGVAIGFAFRAGKGRNLPVAIGIAVLACLLGDALSFHFAYERAVAKAAEELGLDPATASKEETLEAMREAVPFGDYIKARVEEGVTIGRAGGGLPIKGALMYLVWIVEAGILCVLAAGAQVAYLKRPFCEACDRLTEPRALGAIRSVKSGAMSAARAKGDMATLLDPPGEERSGKDAAYTLHACPTCDNRYLTISLEWMQRDRKGKEERKSEDVVQHAVVAPDHIESLRSRLHLSARQ